MTDFAREGDQVSLRPQRSSLRERPLGRIVEIYPNPAGVLIAAVRVGPNNHEIQHYTLSELTVSRANPPMVATSCHVRWTNGLLEIVPLVQGNEQPTVTLDAHAAAGVHQFLSETLNRKD